MSSPTSEQLVEITKRINERLAEFEIPAGIGVVVSVPRGIVRVAHDVIMEFWDADAPPPQKPEDDKMLLADMYVAGVQKGRQEAVLSHSQDGGVMFMHRGVVQSSSDVAAMAMAQVDGVREVVESLTQGKHKGPEVDPPMSDMERFEDEQKKQDAAAVEDAPPNRDKKLTEAEEIKARAYEVIRGLVVNGEMPRQADYNSAKPDDLPSGAHLTLMLGNNWTEIATELGLVTVTPQMRAERRKAEKAQQGNVAAVEPESVTVSSDATIEQPEAEPTPQAKKPSFDDKFAEVRRKMRERVYEHIRSLVVDGRMPLEDDYNATRHPTIPVARDMMNRLGFSTWREVAEDMGLKWPPKPRQ